MTSEVDICNLALAHIRGGRISSLNDGSVQSRYCADFYPILRDQMLRDGNFQFCRTLRSLTSVADAAIFNWRYVYQYPADCLKIERLVVNFEFVDDFETGISPYEVLFGRRLDRVYPLEANLRAQVEYEIMDYEDRQVIVTNEPNLRAQMFIRVTDVNRFDAQFQMALSHLLAANIAPAIVGGQEGLRYKQASLAEYEAYIAAALAQNGNEQHHRAPESDYITYRY